LKGQRFVCLHTLEEKVAVNYDQGGFHRFFGRETGKSNTQEFQNMMREIF